jgi:hypothetical protein
MGGWNFRGHAVLAVARCGPIGEEHTLVKRLITNGYAYHPVLQMHQQRRKSDISQSLLQGDFGPRAWKSER